MAIDSALATEIRIWRRGTCIGPLVPGAPRGKDGGDGSVRHGENVTWRAVSLCCGEQRGNPFGGVDIYVI